MISSNSTPLTKICKQCDIEKPMSEYYRTSNGRGIGGRMARCKDCKREHYRQYNKSKAGKARMKRYYQTEKGLETWRRNNKTPAGRAAFKRYCKANKNKRQAKNAVRTAKQRGDLPYAHELTCQHCGGPASEYHHESYLPEHWLDVIPLCRPCHVALHNQEATA